MAKLIFNAPGNADNLSQQLLENWNEEIEKKYQLLKPDYGSPFFEFDHSFIKDATVVNSVHWFADPAEPAFCMDLNIAQKLSDWGIKGRHNLHNEYCEYVIEYKNDSSGVSRPKRVQVTTELREYWLIIAKHDPDCLRSLASSVLDRDIAFSELYGQDPLHLSIQQRAIAFATQVAGNGFDRDLQNAGVPVQPLGNLNRDNALFMTHPINGLDDLLYIVMFGAKPYARKQLSKFEKVSKEVIFKSFGVEHLACRHADPAAAMGAYEAVFEGRRIAFHPNFGMYIHSFAKNNFSYQGNPLPVDWIRLSRGQNNLYQRLVFGPPDSVDIFLDDISVEEGGMDIKLKGGFQILRHIEVGPVVVVGQATQLGDQDYVLLKETNDSIKCSQAEACRLVAKLWNDYQSISAFVKTGPRILKFKV